MEVAVREDPDEALEGPGALREKVGKLNPQEIEQTVKSSLWWGFAIMIQSLHHLVARFQSWAESSACHWQPAVFDAEQLNNWAKHCRDCGISEYEVLMSHALLEAFAPHSWQPRSGGQSSTS